MAKLGNWRLGVSRPTRFQKGGGKVYVATAARRWGSDGISSTRHGPDQTGRREQLRVLIAEDERSLRDVAASRLVRHGMVVQTVDRLNAIEPTLRQFRPHVIVLDNRFERGGVGSRSILPELVGMYPSVGIVVTTDKQAPGTEQPRDPLTWGAAGVLDKATMFHGTKLEDTVMEAAGL